MAEVADEFEDDLDEVQDLEDIDDEVDGEDLFGENMMRYFPAPRLPLSFRTLTRKGTISHARKQISMTLQTLMTRVTMTTWTPRLGAVSRHSSIDGTGNLPNGEDYNAHPRFSTLVSSALKGEATNR